MQAASSRLAARFVWIAPGRVLAPGELVWDRDGRLLAARRARGPVRDLAVFPGLVNAHAHLQIAPLRRACRRFLPWIDQVMAARRRESALDHRRQAQASMRQLLDSGATAVGEIDSTGRTAGAWRRLPLAGRCYRELVGFDADARAARVVVREHLPDDEPGLRYGLSPHAPYSVSADLFRAAFRRTRHLAIHCAELPEEQAFLHSGGGPFAELLQRLGRMPKGYRAPGCGAVRWLERLGVLTKQTLLVHCQELERGDVQRIAASGASIVVCPGTIEYFRRTPPPVAEWLARGIPVALGTDSHASNTGLDMRQELARAARMWPQLTPEQLTVMATDNGGSALNGPFGRLARGRRADLLAVPARSSWRATLEGFVSGELPIERVVLAGRRRRQAVER